MNLPYTPPFFFTCALRSVCASCTCSRLHLFFNDHFYDIRKEKQKGRLSLAHSNLHPFILSSLVISLCCICAFLCSLILFGFFLCTSVQWDQTALVLAVENSHTATVQVLVDAGANMEARNTVRMEVRERHTDTYRIGKGVGMWARWLLWLPRIPPQMCAESGACAILRSYSDLFLSVIVFLYCIFSFVLFCGFFLMNLYRVVSHRSSKLQSKVEPQLCGSS